jgi:hypothetical protein
MPVPPSCPPGFVRRRSFAICCLLAFANGAMAQDAPRAFLKGPYLQAPGADTMTIMWESEANRPGIVRYGLKGRLDQASPSQAPRELIGVSTRSVTNTVPGVRTNISQVYITNVVYLHEITLTNLRPNSTYTYAAEMNDRRAPSKKFKTFGPSPGRVRFIAYGDTRTNPKMHAAIAAHFRRHSPDFILHTGDLVAAGTRYDLWSREFFGPLSGVIDQIPLLPAIGNHEQDGTNYLRYVHLPGNERWYSYDVGPVHLVALDFRSEKEAEEQFAFARKDLMTAAAPWKVVFLHYPVFNIGGHGTGWGHAAYLPLFHEAKVDLVMAGHSHIYERFRPIAGAAGADTWPITHITTGGGGAPLYATYTHPALAAFATTNHFVLIEATPTRLRGRAITTNEAVIDRFELTKKEGRPPARYLAQVYSEELLKLSLEAAPGLTGELASVPATNRAAEVMFTIPSLKSARQPVDLRIELTPDSGSNYEIENGPLQVSTPPASVTNRVVWTRIRARGPKSIDLGPGQTLSPPLVFQAKVISGGADTLAYGQKCRVTDNATQAAKKGEKTEASR